MNQKRKDKRVALESQDDIAYITGKRRKEGQQEQIKLPKIQCAICGLPLAVEATICPRCGTTLHRDT